MWQANAASEDGSLACRMNIRAAQPRDLEACAALDESFETEYVWQIESARHNGALALNFRTTRLPRSMRVSASLPREVIAEHFELGECFLVAEEHPRICGFIDVTTDRWERVAWVQRLTVAPDLRRHGIGSQLLREAMQWARAEGMRAIMASISSKHYPASMLFQRHGLAFCGYNDQYYHNHDIALFFSAKLK